MLFLFFYFLFFYLFIWGEGWLPSPDGGGLSACLRAGLAARPGLGLRPSLGMGPGAWATGPDINGLPAHYLSWARCQAIWALGPHGRSPA